MRVRAVHACYGAHGWLSVRSEASHVDARGHGKVPPYPVIPPRSKETGARRPGDRGGDALAEPAPSIASQPLRHSAGPDVPPLPYFPLLTLLSLYPG